MLKLNKNITLNGTSEINGVQVAYMSATISTDGNNNGNVNKSISNKELYNANKAEVRKDMADFEEAVYQIEDELLNSNSDVDEVSLTIDGRKVSEATIKTINTKVGK